MAKKTASKSKSSATGRGLRGRPPAVTDLKGKPRIDPAEEFPFIEKAFEAYIKHAHQGWPDSSFYYRDGDNGITSVRLLARLPLHASRLDLSRVDEVTSHRYSHWVQMGMNLIAERGSPQLFIAFMKVLFPKQGWSDVHASDSKEGDFRRLLVAWGVEPQ